MIIKTGFYKVLCSVNSLPMGFYIKKWAQFDLSIYIGDAQLIGLIPSKRYTGYLGRY